MRVNFTATGTSVPDARLSENIAHARSLGLPNAEHRASGRALNIIGRGPSVARYTDILKTDDADAWACGTAWAWCRDNGISATAVFADPSPVMARSAVGCRRAFVSEQCDPLLFEVLSGADVRLMAIEQWGVGNSAATIAAVLGSNPGVETRLYGSEGSFSWATHADENQPQANEMLVRCGGEIFRTNPQMVIQCEEFVHIIRLCTAGVFVNRSGGLLGAMLATGAEWELIEWRNAPANVRAMMEAA